MTSQGEEFSRRVADQIAAALKNCVSYRDMVDYVAQQEAEFHTIRAEGFSMINKELERSEARQERAADRIEAALEEIKAISNRRIDAVRADFTDHEDWHRNVLQGLIDRSTQNKLAIVAIIVSIVGIALSTLVAFIAQFSNR